MMSGTKNKRPSCDEILKIIDSWALNLGTIRKEKVFQSILDLKDSPIDFHKTFLLGKCKFSINSNKICASSKHLFDGSLELDCKNSDLNSSEFWNPINSSDDSDIESTEIIITTDTGKYVTQFKETGLLGSGSFASVYKCQHIYDKAFYAIKKLDFSSNHFSDRQTY